MQKKYILGILVLIGITVFAINSLNTGYRVDDSSSQIIDAHGICHKVTNSSGSNIFVPTKSAQEWSDFRANLPAGVTLGTCPCSGFYYQNYCFHQGDFGQSCDQVCSDKGSCNATGTELIGSTIPATDALNHCRTVTSYYGATSLGDTSTKSELPYGQLGCTLVDSTSYGYLVVHFNAVTTTCAASEASVTRYCACAF